MKTRPAFDLLLQRLCEPRRFIQVLIGPRQVGKTTLAHQVAETLSLPHRYVSADLATLQDVSWLRQQWEVARGLAKAHGTALLIVDEIQKINHWSDVVKLLWDQDSAYKTNLSVMLLGSSPWLMQKGLSESLAGRFETIPIGHWSFAEMQEIFKWPIERYLYFGGYPGAAPLANEAHPERWANYVN